MRCGWAVLTLAVFSGGVHAHRLDEYLQAATISLESGRVLVQLRLAPGVAVLPVVMAGIDRDGDGVVSDGEQRAYAERVLGDLAIAVDGARSKPELQSVKFPKLDALKEGLGEIQVEFAVAVHGGGAHRFVIENHHQRAISVYLVNCLVPREPGVRVTAQNRDYKQSRYELEYVAGAAPWWQDGMAWFVAGGCLLLGRLGMLWWKRGHR